MLKSIGINMDDDMVFHKAIKALRFQEGQLPIVLSSLHTTGESNSAQALENLTINMYETHRPNSDLTDVYHAQESTETDMRHDPDDKEEWEYVDKDGQVYLMRPKKKNIGKNAPWAAETARRGEVANFRNYPNIKSFPKG